jgi:hypothetical protein
MNAAGDYCCLCEEVFLLNEFPLVEEEPIAENSALGWLDFDHCWQVPLCLKWLLVV